MLLATAACNFSTSQLQKVVRTWCVLNILTLKCASCYSRVQFFGPRPLVFNILTLKCASRYSRVQFFDVATSKSGPNPAVFEHFDLQMRFAPQRRAIFRPPNLKKWPEAVYFFAFWLEIALRTTVACNFSFLL